MIEFRRLGLYIAPAFAALRLRGLMEHPPHFGEDITEFAATALETHRQRLAFLPENAIVYGAFLDGEMVGIGGLYRRAGRRKVRHRAELFGMYVQPQVRRRGIGQALLRALVHHARDIKEVEIIGNDNQKKPTYLHHALIQANNPTKMQGRYFF